MTNNVNESTAPALEMPCTIRVGTDRYPGKIVDIRRNGRQVVVMETQGLPDVRVFNLCKDGRFREAGSTQFLGRALHPNEDE